jgi:hypothetical protein
MPWLFQSNEVTHGAMLIRSIFRIRFTCVIYKLDSRWRDIFRILFFIAMESILLLNIYRNIKFNIKFFPQDKISTGKHYDNIISDADY